MPVVHKSTIKRARQAEVRRLRNRTRISLTRAAIKKVHQALDQKNLDQAQMFLREASSHLSRAVSKGVIKKNTASRRISRLTLQINKLKAS